MVHTRGDGAGSPARLRIAMALYSDISFDSRVIREATTLAESGHDVTVYCLGGQVPADAPFRVVARRPGGWAVLPDRSSPFLAGAAASPLAKLTSRVRWVVGYARTVRAWGRWAVRAAGEVDVWHAHDLTGLLAVGPLARKPTRLVYDSHEIFLESGSGARLPGPARRMLSMYERLLTQRAVALVTVNEGYAEVLATRTRPRRVVLVRNCPPRWSPPAGSRRLLRDAVGIDEGVPLVLYHGLLSKTRGIEELLEAMDQPGMDSVHVALLGFGPLSAELAETATQGRFGGRVHVLPAVPPGELLPWIAGADVDVIALQHTTLNHYLCSPNKLWESLAAGVPVVVSDFPVMRRVVLEDPSGALGGVCNPADPASLAAAVLAVLNHSAPERELLRRACLDAAHERWNWERESSRLLELYAEIAAGQ